MTERKTRSLILASDPVARLRELHDLDAPSSLPAVAPVPLKVSDESSAATLQHDNGETWQRSNEETPPQRSAETPERENVEAPKPASGAAQRQSNVEAQQQRNTATKKRGNETPPPEEPITENPVREAMRQVLRQPYSADLSKGPSTATTIRIPTEIWERLDMASTLQSQTKQDIIAEALKQHLKKIGRGEA